MTTTTNSHIERIKLEIKAQRAAMRANALQYRTVVSADYSCDLNVKGRFGCDFVRMAILSRQHGERYQRDLQEELCA